MISGTQQSALYYARRRRRVQLILQSLTPWSPGLAIAAGEYVSSENGSSPWLALTTGTTGASTPYGRGEFNDSGVIWTRADIMSLWQFAFTGAPTPA
jgi:hypothetical protein